MRMQRLQATLLLVPAFLFTPAVFAEDATPATAPAATPASVPTATGGVTAPATANPVPAPTAAEPLPAAKPAKARPGDGLGWVARASYEIGGDDVAKVVFTNGSTKSITAGDGLSVAVGGHYRVPESRFDFSALVGYKLNQVVATNATFDLSRTTFELRADAYLTDDIWVSAGPVLHRNIKADMSGFAPNISFDDANGFAFRIGWKVIALTHTQMTYRDQFGFTYDASTTGIELIGKF